MLLIRPFNFGDAHDVQRMLATEAIPVEDMGFLRFPSFVLDQDGPIGMFTLALEHDVFPHLKHFCMDQAHRNPLNARLLIRAVCAVVKTLGFPKMIVHAKQEYLSKFIRYYFHTKPYAMERGVAFYLVKV